MDAVTKGVKFGHHEVVFDFYFIMRCTIDDDLICRESQAYLFDEWDIFDFLSWEFMFVEEIVLDFIEATLNVGAFAFEAVYG